MALHWIQDNIGAFGGDKDKVTIWGQSSGALSVGKHLIAYQGRDDGPVQSKPKKIVKKVRVQSPPPSSPEDAVPVTSRYPPIDYDDDAIGIETWSV